MTYTVGDVFLGCPASATGRPYNQPTVLHYQSDGVTLIETLTIPTGAAVNEEYVVEGVAVGADGRLYVTWQTNGHASPLVAAGAWLGVFDAAGAWVATLATLSTTPGVNTTLLALPGGDLALTIRDSGTATIDRYQPDGTLVDSWPAPAPGYVRGWARQPGQSARALFLVADTAYVVNLADGSTVTGPVTVPYDPLLEEVHALLASTTAPVLVVQASDDPGVGDTTWYAQTLSSDLTATAGARAQLAADSFPGGGVSHLGLINGPYDTAVDGGGGLGWGVTSTTDTSHSGAPVDSLFRTGLRRTVIPGGTSVAVQSDVNGDTNLVYVFQGFGGARRRSRVGLLR